MEIVGVFFATIILFSMLCGTPDSNTDNGVFTIEEGQSITIDTNTHTIKFYSDEENRTYIYDSLTGELLNTIQGK